MATQRLVIEQAAKQKDLFAKELWPDVTLSGFYNQDTIDKTERNFGLALSFPLPLWNQNRAGILSAESKIKAEKHQLALQERKIDSQVNKLLAEYAAQQKIVAEYKFETIAELKEQLRSIEGEFRKNRVDFLLFLEADIQAAETVNKVLDAQLALAHTISSLYYLARDKGLLSQLSTF